MKLGLGVAYPLGANWNGKGTNFALFSSTAKTVDLCLFDHIDAEHESMTIRMTEYTDQVWHAFLHGVGPGQLYGFRVDGEYNPQAGLRFNRNKVLLDPYAKAISGKTVWSREMFAYPLGSKNTDLDFDNEDNARYVPKSVVIDPSFDWQGDRPLGYPLHSSIIYEVHVQGFTKLCPHIPEEIRGTYAGMSHPFIIDYLKKLGVTAVELLPVHEHVDDWHLLNKNLSNYWGYNTIGFFAPEASYACQTDRAQQVNEFKQMVKALHQAGIEVILDVVYNHTAEGNHLGPTLCFKGIDNPAYYRLVENDMRHYFDYTGTGNTFNVMHPRVLQLIMDSLRYWVLEMHVDGFRFDLASTLARELHAVNKLSAFFDIIHQDPVLSVVKLIAEPWDIGEGGYQVGNFPVLWAEWNGKYRDCVRKYWKGDDHSMGEFAYRITGSSDLYQTTGKRPYASINFITAHDGFTLNDLVSYNEKHNEANLEDNRDGESNNNSWNCGAEGTTQDEAVLKLRRKQRRNFLMTLFLSQGVPMLCGGDEFARTQQGNNNSYCQDNELNWFHWDWSEESQTLFDMTQRLIQFRRDHPVFRRPKFFQGRPIRGTQIKDIMWFNVDGTEMTEEQWQVGYAKCFGLLLSGSTMDVKDIEGDPIQDGTFLLLFNSHYDSIPFHLPGESIHQWRLLINTEDEKGFLDHPTSHPAEQPIQLEARSVMVLELQDPHKTPKIEESGKSA
jgi:glycogen operon protein